MHFSWCILPLHFNDPHGQEGPPCSHSVYLLGMMPWSWYFSGASSPHWSWEKCINNPSPWNNISFRDGVRYLACILQDSHTLHTCQSVHLWSRLSVLNPGASMSFNCLPSTTRAVIAMLWELCRCRQWPYSTPNLLVAIEGILTNPTLCIHTS